MLQPRKAGTLRTICAGQSKKVRGAKARPSNRTHGLRWWLSMVNMDTSNPSGHKCKNFFFELIPKLAYTSRDGTTKYKIRTKEHLCFWATRLLSRGGTLVTDCHKGYSALTKLWRPDVIHYDCNHSVGFGAPGPLSIRAGMTRVSSNAVEGAHAALYKLLRRMLGSKIGTGSERHHLLIKDFAVCLLNWGWHFQYPMQEIFLWMR